MAELLEKYQQTEREGGIVSKENEITKHKEEVKNDSDRIIGSTKEMFETTSMQQKIDPVITTREVAISTEANQVLLSPTTFMIYVKDKGVQTLPMQIKKKRKCTNCCGGLPGCGPGLGQGCEGKCSCVPGIEITANGLYDEDELNLNRTLFPRFYVTRNRLRGGGGGIGGKNLRKIVMARIRCRRKKKNSIFQIESSLGRPKEDLLCRGFDRSLSSLRGQRMGLLEKAQESCWEGYCSRSKNCIGRVSVSAECVPSSYNYVRYVVPGVPERRQNFRLEQNIMADGSSTSCSKKFQRETTTATPLLLSTNPKYYEENVRRNRRSNRRFVNFYVPGKTISNINCPTKNCSHFFSDNTKRVGRAKTPKEYNFSKGILPRKNSSSSSYQTLKLVRMVERLRGGGSKCDLTEQHNKLRQQMELADQSAIDNLNDIEMNALHDNKENNVGSNAMFCENLDEDEYPWSDNVINEDVLRFQEDQGYCGSGPENRNEDGRIRGGCGGLYKPIQHFSNAWTIFGRRNLHHPRGSCCTPGRPQTSCRSSPYSPLSCLRSSPTCTAVRFPNRVSCKRIDPCIDIKDCLCNSCGDPICSDEINRCHGIQLKEQLPYSSARRAKAFAFEFAVDAVVNPAEEYTVAPVAVVVLAVFQEIPENGPTRNAAVVGIRTAEDAAKDRTIPES
ncbi:hypothetical protein M0804_010629 [Polistes exclamans]|nr:hypothetical protein M0804_010629 [Polistes exclamans]